MSNAFILLAAGLAVFWWLGGFALLAMRKRSKLKKSIKPVCQSPARNQLLLDLQSNKATSIAQIDAFLIAKSLMGNEAWPETYHLKYPNNASFSFLYANALIRKAWLVRGSGAASTVTPDAAQQFLAYLTKAEALLQALVSNSTLSNTTLSNNTVAADGYEPLLLVYKGLGKQQAAADFYQTIAPRAATRLDVHLARMSQITPRWGGNIDDLFALVRGLFNRGAVISAALAAGWFEYAYDGEIKGLMQHIERAGEKDTLIAAFKQLNAAPAIISSHEDYLLVLAHNCYAMLFYYADDKKLACEALEKTSGYYTSYPWQLINKDAASGFYSAAVKCKVSGFKEKA